MDFLHSAFELSGKGRGVHLQIPEKDPKGQLHKTPCPDLAQAGPQLTENFLICLEGQSHNVDPIFIDPSLLLGGGDPRCSGES